MLNVLLVERNTVADRGKRPRKSNKGMTHEQIKPMKLPLERNVTLRKLGSNKHLNPHKTNANEK